MTYPCETCLQDIQLLPYYSGDDVTETYEEVGHKFRCKDKNEKKILDAHWEEL